jgi:CheY-like chemotaxis protein
MLSSSQNFSHGIRYCLLMAKTLERPKKLLKRVLLVEDDVDVNDAFSVLLTKGGYEVLGAYNGKEALEKIPSFNPEVILLDLLMPIMDGNEFLRTYDNDDHIPIIVFSSLDSRTEVETALKLGATRYMLKAWATPEELFRMINDAV